MDQLQKEYEFKQLTIKLYDREVPMPKLTAFSGEPVEGLDYTLEDLPVQPWSDTRVKPERVGAPHTKDQ